MPIAGNEPQLSLLIPFMICHSKKPSQRTARWYQPQLAKTFLACAVLITHCSDSINHFYTYVMVEATRPGLLTSVASPLTNAGWDSGRGSASASVTQLAWRSSSSSIHTYPYPNTHLNTPTQDSPAPPPRSTKKKPPKTRPKPRTQPPPHHPKMQMEQGSYEPQLSNMVLAICCPDPLQ